MNRTLAASENPATIAKNSAWYSAYSATPRGVGARPVRARNVTSTHENRASVITAFDAEVTTTIHDGNFAFVSRYPLARIDSSPALVDSWKNSYRNKPMMRSNLYCGSLANT